MTLPRAAPAWRQLKAKNPNVLLIVFKRHLDFLFTPNKI